jgi:heptosyltransferase-3
VKLLFIKLRHLGDALLLTPTLATARRQYPDAEIVVLTRRGCDGILAGCTAIDRIVTTAEAESGNRSPAGWFDDLRLILRLRRERFDYGFELSESERGRWMGWLCRPKQLCLQYSARPLGGWWQSRADSCAGFAGFLGHAVVKDFQTVAPSLGLAGAIPPVEFDRQRTAPSSFDTVLGRFVVIHAGTRWQRKRWPFEKWEELARNLMTRFDRVVVSSSVDDAELSDARRLQMILGERVVATEGRLSWSQLAGVLYRASLVVGVDTAVTHLAAACRRPVVVLFGPSFEGHWRPWQTPHSIVLPPGFEELTATEGDVSIFQTRRTADICVQDVLAACDRLVVAST